MGQTVLQTTALTKKYGQTTVLDCVSLTVEAGEIYGFIGQNGAGKTTTQRLIAGLTFPTSGEVSLFGHTDPAGLRHARRRIGFMVDGPAFFPKLTALQNLEHYRIQRGVAEKESIHQVLEQVGLADTGKKQYRHFSAGMRQRLGVALALLSSPDMLVLDEPINGLDPVGIVEMRTLLLRLNREQGVTLFLSSHILSELSQMATQYGIIHQGRLVKTCTKEELDRDTRRSLLLNVSDTAAAATVMEEVLLTRDYEVLEHHQIRLFSYLDQPGEVSAALVQNGVDLHSLREIGADLETYFLQAIATTEKGVTS